MIAVDTNILVYAHRADSPFHDRARLILESLATGARAWAIPWPCAHEFFAVVTHPRIYKTATPAVCHAAAEANEMPDKASPGSTTASVSPPSRAKRASVF